jgi:spore coat protein U-like protein
MKKRVFVRVAAVTAAAMCAAAGHQLHAANQTANLAVSATVANNCTITTGALVFGSYDPVVANAGTNLEGTGSVTVACTKGAAATIGLGSGANGSSGSRRLADGARANFLDYELFQNEGYSTVWSEANTRATGAAPSKDARSFTVYGRINSGQDVPAGSYGDTVLATVNF